MKILLPTCLTFSDIRAGVTDQALAIINEWLASVGRDPVAVGSQNPFVLLLNDFAIGGQPWIRSGEMTGLASCGEIVNVAHFPKEYIGLIVGVGGEIERYPAFFEVDALTREVPEYFPGATYTDDSGSEVPHSFESWLGSGHEAREIQGKWYLEAIANETRLSGSLLYAVIADTARTTWLRVLSQAEYNNLNKLLESES